MKVGLVIPAHGRFALTRACLQMMRWTIDELAPQIELMVYLVANDRNLLVGRELGFKTFSLGPNDALGTKFNVGCRAALQAGCQYVVPCGSDDILHPELFRKQALPRPLNSPVIPVTRHTSVVREDGLELACLKITYEGGDGIRFLPRKLMEQVKGRPASHERQRAIDSSMLQTLRRCCRRLRFEYAPTNPLWIVDFKMGENLNTYAACHDAFAVKVLADPWPQLAELYPEALLEPIRSLYGLSERPIDPVMAELRQGDALKLKILTSIAGHGFVYQPLEEHLVPRPFADTLLAAGKAELLEERPKTKPRRSGKPKAPARSAKPDGW